MPLFPLRAAPLAETEKNSVISFFTIFHKRFHRFQQLKHDCAVMFIICSYQLSNRYRIHRLLQRDSRLGSTFIRTARAACQKERYRKHCCHYFFICILSFHLLLKLIFLRPADNFIHRPLRQVPLIRH